MASTRRSSWPGGRRPPSQQSARSAMPHATSCAVARAGLRVTVSHLLGDPRRMWTMTHPANALLLDLARSVLTELGANTGPSPQPTEFLGERRTPVDPAVSAGLGTSPLPERDVWVIAGRRVPLFEIVHRQLQHYASRPDIVEATLARESIPVAAAWTSGERRPSHATTNDLAYGSRRRQRHGQGQKRPPVRATSMINGR